MAFSTTNVQSAYLPPLKVVMGDWSGLSGDAAGTLTIGGRYVGSLWFKNDTTTSSSTVVGAQTMTNALSSQVFPVVNWDGNVPGTLTIQNQDNVTTGSFLIFTRGG
jgi:hypothetical protein